MLNGFGHWTEDVELFFFRRYMYLFTPINQSAYPRQNYRGVRFELVQFGWKWAMSFLILLVEKMKRWIFFYGIIWVAHFFIQLPFYKAKCGVLGYCFWRNQSFQYKSFRFELNQWNCTQKKFDHFKLSLAFSKKNIWLECSLFFRQVFETIHTWTEQTFIETIGNRLWTGSPFEERGIFIAGR